MAEFPLRLAAIDVGSNAIRYTVGEFADPDHWTEVAGERIAVRLGRDVFTRERRLSDETLEAGTRALVQIRRRLDDLGVQHYRAVATSAVRESRNGSEFVDRVRGESGIHLETISGSEEARLVWLAVCQRIKLGERRWVLMDLGGGSVEVSIMDQDGIRWSESHSLGSVRLLQTFRDDAVEGDEDLLELLARYVQVLRVPRLATIPEPRGVIATGGNIEALARLCGASSDANGVRSLPLADLSEVLGRLADFNESERVDRFGLRTDRADVIVPAGVVYEHVAKLAEADEIVVPGVGVREGVLLDLRDERLDRVGHTDRQTRGTLAAAVALGRRCRFDESHGRHVAKLSLSMFDQLTDLHGLGRSGRRILQTGALLHDIGQFISYRRHHKHSCYIISNADLPGLSSGELAMAALVARYHRRANPQPKHPGYGELPKADRDLVRKLAAILRVCDALDREHLSRVRKLEVRRTPEGFDLHARVRGASGLESWALRKKGHLFRDVFGGPVRFDPHRI